MSQTLNVLLAGVGGQGTILASDILVNVGLAAGLDAKQAEVHGMSQRGGSVTSYVRWGEVVHSPLVGAGEVDVLLAFEKLEALRYLTQLRRDALAVISVEAITPVTVSSLGQRYPADQQICAAVAQVTARAVYVDGPGIAQDVGDRKVTNIVLLGALSALLERHAKSVPAVPEAIWQDVIVHMVPPKYVELNRRAFHAGRDVVAAAV